jgi:hypothetical protein
MIRRDQMKKEWMLRRAMKYGCFHYQYQWKYKDYLLGRPVLFLGIPRHMIREILEQTIQVVRTKLSQDADTAFKERWQLYYLVGRAIGSRIVFNKKP